jgi:hypothetical protein
LPSRKSTEHHSGRGLNNVVRPATVWLGDRLKRAVLSVIKAAMIKSGVFHGTVPDAVLRTRSVLATGLGIITKNRDICRLIGA